MPLGALVPCLGLLVTVTAVAAATDVKSPAPPPFERNYGPLRARPAHRPAFPADVDAQVLANLFAIETRSDFDVALTATTVGCDPRICRVSLNVKLPETTAPAHLSFAVAGPKGELSDVVHADCLTSLCTVELLLKRGTNVIAVGAADALTRGSGFATTQLLVDPPKTRKAEWF